MKSWKIYCDTHLCIINTKVTAGGFWLESCFHTLGLGAGGWLGDNGGGGVAFGGDGDNTTLMGG